MILLGLAGKAGSGKDTVALYLQRAYGFQIFSFSDTLYSEVQEAFGLPSQDLLRDRETKEVRSHLLAMRNCLDIGFIDVVKGLIRGDTLMPWRDQWISPRQILQWWGTEYRRAQDPNYWVFKASDWLNRLRAAPLYPEHAPQLFVNTSVRFQNERDWIHARHGNVWHLRRDGFDGANNHVSEEPLEVWTGERELWNNDTIERLHKGVDLLLTTNAAFVRVEPMEKYEPPEHDNTDDRERIGT